MFESFDPDPPFADDHMQEVLRSVKAKAWRRRGVFALPGVVVAGAGYLLFTTVLATSSPVIATIETAEGSTIVAENNGRVDIDGPIELNGPAGQSNAATSSAGGVTSLHLDPDKVTVLNRAKPNAITDVEPESDITIEPTPEPAVQTLETADEDGAAEVVTSSATPLEAAQSVLSSPDADTTASSSDETFDEPTSDPAQASSSAGASAPDGNGVANPSAAPIDTGAGADGVTDAPVSEQAPSLTVEGGSSAAGEGAVAAQAAPTGDAGAAGDPAAADPAAPSDTGNAGDTGVAGDAGATADTLGAGDNGDAGDTGDTGDTAASTQPVETPVSDGIETGDAASAEGVPSAEADTDTDTDTANAPVVDAGTEGDAGTALPLPGTEAPVTDAATTDQGTADAATAEPAAGDDLLLEPSADAEDSGAAAEPIEPLVVTVNAPIQVDFVSMVIDGAYVEIVLRIIDPDGWTQSACGTSMNWGDGSSSSALCRPDCLEESPDGAQPPGVDAELRFSHVYSPAEAVVSPSFTISTGFECYGDAFYGVLNPSLVLTLDGVTLAG